MQTGGFYWAGAYACDCLLYTSANEKDLFYWLHENGFYPQSQFTLSAIQTAEYETETIQISNLSACSLYRYEPFSVLPTYAGTSKNLLLPSTVKTSGWNGEREYSYVVIADASTILPQILDALQQGEPSSSYLQMESAYRDFVDSYALAVPQEFTDELGALLEETRKNLNFSGELSKEDVYKRQAQGRPLAVSAFPHRPQRGQGRHHLRHAQL